MEGSVRDQDYLGEAEPNSSGTLTMSVDAPQFLDDINSTRVFCDTANSRKITILLFYIRYDDQS